MKGKQGNLGAEIVAGITLNQEILDIKNQELSSTLTVYSRPSIAQCWLVPALGALPNRYPSISLTMLTSGDSVNLQRAGIDWLSF